MNHLITEANPLLWRIPFVANEAKRQPDFRPKIHVFWDCHSSANSTLNPHGRGLSGRENKTKSARFWFLFSDGGVRPSHQGCGYSVGQQPLGLG
ncbi:hypothetical protein NPIL_170511 [Nephila pilipes]|uniref:Uncharacterized protein n=1 Tax=Nephila pilipes TaxID=299642 RepID=A0A8X6PW88_NEPPI|nr:hypothetical protein NPIL_170511 [Nephila pilipes]